MSSFTRTDRAHEDWARAVALAGRYAGQIGRRFRVRGVRSRLGWWWKVEALQPKRHVQIASIEIVLGYSGSWNDVHK